jgi:hypothetical protein
VKTVLTFHQEDNLESQLLKKKGLTNTMSLGAKKPCIDDCIVLSLATSIEYDDGKTADVKSGVCNSSLFEE